MTPPPYLATHPRLRWDYRLGGRGCGLILYGILPSSLTALKVLEVPSFVSAGLEELIALLTLALIPTVVTFLLVRQRLQHWYLLTYRLSLRSFAISGATFLASSLIAGASGIIHGSYKFIDPISWLKLEAPVRWRPCLESLLLGAIVLIGSSTLFLTAVTKRGGLPSLPSTQFTDELAKLKESLHELYALSFWSQQIPPSSIDEARHVLRAVVEIEDKLLRILPSDTTRHQALQELRHDIKELEGALETVGVVNLKWGHFFGSDPPPRLNPVETERRLAIERLSRMSFHV